MGYVKTDLRFVCFLSVFFFGGGVGGEVGCVGVSKVGHLLYHFLLKFKTFITIF